ncbi:sigma factor-like helix-turn-helix DNA-binding protein [Streptomyces sp. NPDC005125]
MTVDPSQRSATARRVLKQLSPEHRAVLVHVYFRGLSVSQAAVVLGVSTDTVKSHTYCALLSLKKALSGNNALT